MLSAIICAISQACYGAKYSFFTQKKDGCYCRLKRFTLKSVDLFPSEEVFNGNPNPNNHSLGIYAVNSTSTCPWECFMHSRKQEFPNSTNAAVNRISNLACSVCIRYDIQYWIVSYLLNAQNIAMHWLNNRRSVQSCMQVLKQTFHHSKKGRPSQPEVQIKM